VACSAASDGFLLAEDVRRHHCPQGTECLHRRYADRYFCASRHSGFYDDLLSVCPDPVQSAAFPGRHRFGPDQRRRVRLHFPEESESDPRDCPRQRQAGRCDRLRHRNDRIHQIDRCRKRLL